MEFLFLVEVLVATVPYLHVLIDFKGFIHFMSIDVVPVPLLISCETDRRTMMSADAKGASIHQIVETDYALFVFPIR